jgi:N-hydroxyarylamine O-acetyltransferase
MSIAQQYLDVLGYSEPTFDDLSSLMGAHVDTFAFSSIDVLIGNDVSLDIDDVFKKLVTDRRGGYCFEHNRLFFEVMKSAGMNVTPYLARVVNNQDITPPKTHRISVVKDGGKQHLVDVGFGPLGPAVPVCMDGNYVTSHMGRQYRVSELADGFLGLQLLKDGEPYTLYKFDLQKCYDNDFITGNFYSYRHPKATFVNNLVVSRISDGVIYSLRNNTYMKIHADSQEDVAIDSFEAMYDVLAEDFQCRYERDEIKEIYNRFF